MFNTVLTIILFCALWQKLYVLGIQSERQEEHNTASCKVSKQKNQVNQQPPLAFQNIRSRARTRTSQPSNERVQKNSQLFDGVTKKLNFEASSENKHRKTTSRQQYFKQKVLEPSIRKPLKSPKVHRLVDNTPLSHKIRNALVALIEEEDQQWETIGTEKVSTRTEVKQNSPEKRKTPSSEEQINNTIQPPYLNKRRRLVFPSQKGFPHLLEEDTITTHVYEHRLSRLLQKAGQSTTQISAATTSPQEKQVHTVYAEKATDIPNSETDVLATNASSTNSSIPVTSNSPTQISGVSYPIPSVEPQSYPQGLASVVFQSGQSSNTYSRHRRTRHRR